jgi:AraC-like DNA-binding protein
MNVWQTFLIIFCGLGLTQSLFLGISLLIKDRLKFNALFYAGVLLLGLALRLVKSYFVFIPQKYPHLGIVAGGAGLWLIGPGFYLYTLHSINPSKRSTLFYLTHFVPAAVILLTGTTDYVYYVGLLHFFIYFTLGVHRANKVGWDRIPKHFQVFTTCTGLILLCFIIQASQGGIEIYTLGVGVAIGILYVINYFILKESGFFKSNVRKSKAVDKQLAVKITTDLSNVFLEKKIYRNKGLTITELARQINYPSYLISQSINQLHNMHFNEFVNRFRVQEAMERLKRNTNDKIETIAGEVGFSSMSSLYEAFKKETNLTPQVFRNKQFGEE